MNHDFTIFKPKKREDDHSTTNQEPAGKKSTVDPWERLGKINRIICLGYGGPSIEKQTRPH